MTRHLGGARDWYVKSHIGGRVVRGGGVVRGEYIAKWTPLQPDPRRVRPTHAKLPLMSTRFQRGLSTPFRGFAYLREHKHLWPYVLPAALVNVLITGVALAVLVLVAVALVAWVHPMFGSGTWAIVLEVIVIAAVVLVVLGLTLVCWMLMQNIIAGHLMSKLAERVEKDLGIADGEIASVRFRRQVVDGGLDTGLLLGINLVGFAIQLVPGVGTVVGVPMVFIGDTRTRILLGAVGITLSVALVGSLFVALLLMPAALARGKNSAFTVDPQEDLHLPKWSPIRWLMSFNHVLLSAALKVRWLAVLGLILLIQQIGPAFEGLDFETDGGGPFSSGDVTVRLEMPPGLSLKQVNDEAIAFCWPGLQ